MKKASKFIMIFAAFCMIAGIFYTVSPVKVAEAAGNGQPGAMLIFNEQTVNVVQGNSVGDYSSYPTQIYSVQTGVSYDPDTNSMKLEYVKDNNNPDPQLYLPVRDMKKVNLAEYPVVAIRYKNNTDKTRSGFYFSIIAGSAKGMSENAPNLSESKYVSLSLTKDNSWHTATSNVGGSNYRWVGNISQIRLDIFTSDFAGECYVKWIGFFKTEDDAKAFGRNESVYEGNKITPDKTTFDRGETISAKIASSSTNDWVALVQKGDALCMDSKYENNLYFGQCMPLLWAPVSDGYVNLDMDSCGGIYSGKLLPAGEYDLVYCPRGRFSEMYRTTINVTDKIMREPAADTKIYITQAPESEATPTPRSISDDIEPDITMPPATAPVSAEKSGGNSAVFVIIGIAAVVIAAVVIIIVKAKKTPKS